MFPWIFTQRPSWYFTGTVMTVPNVAGRISVSDGEGSWAKAAGGMMSSAAAQVIEKTKVRLPIRLLLSEYGWPKGAGARETNAQLFG